MCKKQYIRKYKLIQSFNSIFSSLTFDKTFLSFVAMIKIVLLFVLIATKDKILKCRKLWKNSMF
jgi:F0F1-type ATP synthase membrane subunit a